MLFCLPATHVYAHFRDYGLRILHFNAVDSRKVHPRDAVQLPAKVKTGFVPTRVLASAWFRYRFAQRVDPGFHPFSVDRRCVHRNATDIADHVGQLDVHFGQRLLHMLNTSRGGRHQILPLS
jgi:hypothetical protein